MTIDEQINKSEILAHKQYLEREQDILNPVTHIFLDKTIGTVNKPLVCREFCEKVKNCKLENHNRDLCTTYMKHPGQMVRYNQYVPNAKQIKLNRKEVLEHRKQAQIDYDFKRNERAERTTWEQLSSTPSIIDIEKHDLPKKSEWNEYGIITKKDREISDYKIAERMIAKRNLRIGLKYQAILEHLLNTNPDEAKAYGQKLTIYTWKCISAVGGIKKPLTVFNQNREIYF